METDLELAYRTLNALSQGQPVSMEEIDLARACVNRVIHQIRALRRPWEEMSRYLQRPDIRAELAPREPSTCSSSHGDATDSS